MAQNLFDVAGTGNRSYTLMDANFTQLWSMRDKVRTGAYGSYSGYSPATYVLNLGPVDVTTNAFYVFGGTGSGAGFTDAGNSADNRLQEFFFDSGVLRAQAVNDAYSAVLEWMAVTGGYAAGITSIRWTANAFQFAGSGSVLVVGTGGLGYGTGSGGSIAQATSKSTGVTLNKTNGQITLNSASLAADTAVSFTLTNSTISATDLIVLNHVSAGTFGAYMIDGRAAAGSATIVVRNLTAGALAEAIVIGFAVVKAVTS